MKKFLSAVMTVMLTGLIGMFVVLFLYHDRLGLQWNDPLTGYLQSALASVLPQGSDVSAGQAEPEPASGDKNTVSVLRDAAPVSKHYPVFHQTAGLDSLTDSGSRALYQELLKSVHAIAKEADKDGYYPTDGASVKGQELSEKQIRTAVLALRGDNPQIFWLASQYSYTYRSGNTTVRLFSYLPPEKCSELVKKMNAAVASVIGAVPAGLSELDREIYLFQAIAKMCTYDNAAVTDSKRWAAHEATGVLVDGTAVCEGYSEAMQLLASYCGLDCRTVSGSGNGEPHMWNIIKIDGEWYHLDSTWGDSDLVNYNYFNVTDSIIRADHSISGNILLAEGENVKNGDGSSVDYNLPLPACTSMKANYFRAKGIAVSGFNSKNNNKASAALAAAAKTKSPTVEFYIDEKLNYENTVAQMVGAPRYQLSSYVEQANRTLKAGSRINEDKIQYVQAEKCRGLTVILEYD
ncbi:transglutaminase domain-containing protein [Caproiciproducens faecalis]|uniref:Transglutaminase-like domain-containing protein n=1 Tax=Caproiciproducens faecalis TaxID=2820301 RepID=A0ABS7DPL9_9FIRM|nr:transglutaminase domain-containing protein [Caproiciproducens faecalis]MBW7573222.1 hypothetical protein [Caproiciproducens faecalis]